MKSTWKAYFAYFQSAENKVRFGDYFSKSKWIKSRLVNTVMMKIDEVSIRLATLADLDFVRQDGFIPIKIVERKIEQAEWHIDRLYAT